MLGHLRTSPTVAFQMSTVDVQELRQDPDTLLKRVEAGEHLLVVCGGLPIAELRPVPTAPPGPRPFGLCVGEFTVPDDFDAPLSENNSPKV